MSSKIFVFSSAALLLLSLPSPSLAITQNFRQELDQNRIETQEKIREIREEYLDKLEEIKTTPRPTSTQERIQTRDQVVEIRREMKATISGERQEAAQERRGILSQAKLGIVQKIYQNSLSSLQKRYEYLIQTRQKIQEKLSLRAQNGADVTESTNKINQAIALEATYKENLAALEAKYQEMLVS